MALCPNGHQSATDDYCDTCGEPIGGSAGGSFGTAAAASSVGSAGPGGASNTGPAQPSGGGTTTCANCGAAVSGRFCEACGFDTALPAPPRAAASPSVFAAAADPEPSPACAEATGAEATGAEPAGAEPAGVVPAGPPAESAPAAEPELGGRETAAGWSAVVRADRDFYDRALARRGPDAGAIGFPPYYAERRFRLRGTEMMIGKHDEAAGIHPDIDLRGNPEDPGVSRTHAVLRATPTGWAVVDIGSTNGTVIGDAVDPVAEFTPTELAPGDTFHIGAWTTVTLLGPG